MATMDDPAYQDVLQALNSLISEKPKAADKKAYEAAYQSMETYLEVLNLMLLVRLRGVAHCELCMLLSASVWRLALQRSCVSSFRDWT